MRLRWPEPGPAIRDLNPGYFALVMATGIVSQAMSMDGARHLSGVQLGAGILAYVVLAAAYVWRLLGYRREFLADARDPHQAFAFFTFVAASDVLATRLADDGHTPAALSLLTLGAAGWLVLTYGLPLLLAGRQRTQSFLAGANGTWFVCVVATQSIAVAATALPPPVSAARMALAVGCWSVGVVLYLLIASVVSTALLTYPPRPADLTPPYWLFMGATAISVLAGAQIMQLRPGPLAAGVHGIVSGLSVVLWVFGTWIVPLLIAAGIWRHLLHRVPLRYEPGLWSIVFPLGMYGVASRQLGEALRVPWLVTLGRAEAWVAFAAWAALVTLMVSTVTWRPVRRAAGGPGESY